MSGTRYGQFCALARATEIIGERWTLLIVRELLLGPKRFGEIGARLAGLSPTLLTQRLNSLIEDGVVRRAVLPSPANAQIYELTAVGRDLRPAVHALIRWGGHFLFPMRADEAFEPDWVLLALDAIIRRSPTPACAIVLKVRHGRKSASFLLQGGPGGTSIARSEAPGAAATMVETRFDTLLRVLARQVSVDAAIAEGQMVLQGKPQIARKLPELFELKRRGGTY